MLVVSQTSSWSRRERSFHFPQFTYFQQYKKSQLGRTSWKAFWNMQKHDLKENLFLFLRNFQQIPKICRPKKRKKKVPNTKIILTSNLIDNYLSLRVRGSWKPKKIFMHLADLILVRTLVYAGPYLWNRFLMYLLLSVPFPKNGVVETCCSTGTASPSFSPATSFSAYYGGDNRACHIERT